MLALAVVGLLASGTLLERLAQWNSFVKVDKFMILVPILFNLKGNLEMNLSLRMSTAANMGEVDSRRTRRALVTGNLALLQVQALIVAGVAGIISFLLGQRARSGVSAAPTASPNATSAVASVTAPAPALLRRGLVHSPKRPGGDPALRLRDGYFEFALVITVSMLSASFSSAMQGAFLCALIIWTRRLGGNPDNTAVPIAGSFGDLITLTLLGILANALVRFEGTFFFTLVLILLVLACVAFVMLTLRNAYVHELLADGWIALFSATLISSGAGVLLDENASHFPGFSLLVPVVSGLPGAAAAIFASRISTALHSGRTNAPTRPAQDTREYVPLTAEGVPGEGTAPRVPRRSFLGALAESCAVRAPAEGWTVPVVLLANSAVLELGFLALMRAVGKLYFGVPFALCFVVMTLVSNAFSLFLAHWLCHTLWYWDYDPDLSCLPYLTSLVDVVGQALLLGTFSTARAMGDRFAST